MKVTTNLENLYNDIANLINESVGNSWIKSWVIAEMEDDNGELTGYFVSSEGSNEETFWTHEDLYAKFDELRRVFSDTEKGAWDKAVFTLSPDGEFSIDFEYKENSEKKL